MRTDPTAWSDVTWRDRRILSVLLLVLLVGAVSGAAGMRFFIRTRPPQLSLGDWQAGTKERTLARFKQELNLSPEQSVQVEEILDDFVMYVQTLQAQMDDVRATGKQKILACLTPEQREKFLGLIKELQPRAAAQ